MNSEDISMIDRDSFSCVSNFSCYQEDDEDQGNLIDNYATILKEYDSMDSEELLSLYQQCNKSNYIKNILNQFMDYINVSGDQVVIESISETTSRNLAQIRKEFNCFIKQKSLNQGLLVSVLKSKRFSVQFQYFLNYYTKEWVLKNHLKNIRLHLLCICFMKRCLEDVSLIESIKKYKKRS